MENEEKVVSFWEFANEVVKEFKLAGKNDCRLSANIDAGSSMIKNCINKQGKNHAVMVDLKVSFGNGNGDKFICFTQLYTHDEITSSVSETGRIERPENLPLYSDRLKLKQNGSAYNFGVGFDGDKFVDKIFKNCRNKNHSGNTGTSNKTDKVLASAGGEGK